MNDRKPLWILDILALLCGGVLVAAFFHLPTHGNIPRFEAECIKAYDGQKPGAFCGSREAIRASYGIDIDLYIQEQWQKASYTAKHIASGELTDPAAYDACIRGGKCIAVPLLPDEKSHEKAEKSDEFMDVRTAFWDMAESEKITEAACSYIDICRIMTETNVVTLKALQGKN